MAYRFEVASQAMADIRSLYEYVNADSSSAGAKWFNALEDLIVRLETLPRLGKIFDGRRRQIFHGKKPHLYRVVYLVDEQKKQVLILYLRHGARREPLSHA